MKISALNYKIVSYPEVPNFNADDSVDWAFEMLSLGYETENLLILAGISKPTNYLEIIGYLKKALSELDIETKYGEAAIACYASFYINKIAQAENVKDHLDIIYRYCMDKDCEKIVFDFYLLRWACVDLDYGLEYTSYWHDANKENIESLVVENAKQWMVKNEKLFEIKSIQRPHPHN